MLILSPYTQEKPTGITANKPINRKRHQISENKRKKGFWRNLLFYKMYKILDSNISVNIILHNHSLSSPL